MLADRGHLRFNQPVCEIWPGFGRKDVTVADVMRHEAGLASIGHTFSFSDLSADGVARNAVGNVLAAATPAWPPHTPRQYHAITRGWIENEIVRRADPNGRTIGVILKEDVCGLMPGVSLHIGIAPTAAAGLGVVPMFVPSPVWAVAQAFVPSWLGRRVPFGPSWCLSHMWEELKKNVIYRTNLPFPDPFAVTSSTPTDPFAVSAALEHKVSLIDDWNHPLLRSVEIPSANGHANAFSMASVASALACGGEIPGNRGTRLLSKEGVAMATGSPVVRYDAECEAETSNTNAGWAVFDEAVPDDRGGFMGWMGYGGSCLQFHPDPSLRIGFGFANNLAAIDLNNAALPPDGYLHCELQRAVLEAAKAIATP